MTNKNTDGLGKASHGALKDDRRTWTMELKPHCAFWGHTVKKQTNKKPH